LLTVGFAVFYVEVEKAPVVAGLSRGITAAVVGLLATVTLSAARSLVRDGAGVLIGLASFAALELLGLNPVWAILGAAGLGLLAYRDAEGGPGPCSGASS
jgi:chromate transport protein ChrA